MSRPDQGPGRRRAVPEPKGRRVRQARPAPQPSRVARPTRNPKRLKSPKQRRSLSARGLALLWSVLILTAFAALVSVWVPLDVPTWVPHAGAVTVTTLYAFALGVRTGGRPVIAGLLALALSVAAVVTQTPVLLAAGAVSTAAAGAVLGVLATVPAARYSAVVRECLVAVLVAAVAAFAADGYDAQLSVERAEYLALALALLGALALVYRLGAGFQGLGTRGGVVIIGGIAVLAVSLAYTEALTRWGSPGMIEVLEQAVDDIRSLLWAVPHPLEFLLGFPALAWGVSTRARRRQGWWACAFGAAGLAGVTTSLLDHTKTLLESGLSTAYAVGLGLLLGYLVVRFDAFLSGTRGARARRAEEASAHRPEPRRTEPLL